MLVHTRKKVLLLPVPGKNLEHTSITILVVDSISQCHSPAVSVMTLSLIYPLSRSLNLVVFSGVPGKQMLRMCASSLRTCKEERFKGEKAYCGKI